MRDRIANIICAASVMSRTPVIAFTVMPNHLHLIVRQTAAPLAWLMHRVLHRAALAVKQTYNPDGHVFGARFYSGICEDAAHARQVIIYTHLNPVYAGICAHPRDYRWSSYHCYASNGANAHCVTEVQAGLRLFAANTSDERYMRENHEAHIAYWMARKRLTLGERYIFAEQEPRIGLRTDAGDAFWKMHCCENSTRTKSSPARAKPPVADRAATLLVKLDPAVSLDYLRMCGRGRIVSTLRRELIAALLTSGYTGASIARCLNVSSALVSSVRQEVEQTVFSPIRQ